MIKYLASSIVFTSIISCQQTLPIGVVLNLQTPLQIAGVALLNFTVAELNANNAFPVPIQLIVRDSQNSIRQAVLQADAMVNQNNIVSLIGEFPSGKLEESIYENQGITQPLASAMSQYGLTQCSVSQSSALSNKVEFPNFFRSIPSDVITSASFISICKAFGWKRVSLLVLNQAYGVGLSKTFIDSSLLNGIKVLANEIYSLGQTDFSAIFAKFKSVDTKIVFIFGYDQEIQYMLQVQ